MANSFEDKRLIFKKGVQGKFILETQDALCMKRRELAGLLQISERTLRDWIAERHSMSLVGAETLARTSKVPIPKEHEIIDRRDHLKSIASSGGKSVLKKYGHIGGDIEKKSDAWQKWWEENGRFARMGSLARKPVHFPNECRELAEFVGIMIGDGGVSEYFITVTLHSEDDKEYSRYISKQFKVLFHVEPKVYVRTDSNTMILTIHRKSLVEFCKSIGLHSGNKLKQGLSIPNWIFTNPEYQSACLRGLVDTDGSVFEHCYNSKGKRYCYPKIGFSSASPALLRQVHALLKKFCIKSRMHYNGKDIRIEAMTDVRAYFDAIGTNNPKHQSRFERFIKNTERCQSGRMGHTANVLYG